MRSTRNLDQSRSRSAMGGKLTNTRAVRMNEIEFGKVKVGLSSGKVIWIFNPRKRQLKKLLYVTIGAKLKDDANSLVHSI